MGHSMRGDVKMQVVAAVMVRGGLQSALTQSSFSHTNYKVRGICFHGHI